METPAKWAPWEEEGEGQQVGNQGPETHRALVAVGVTEQEQGREGEAGLFAQLAAG